MFFVDSPLKVSEHWCINTTMNLVTTVIVSTKVVLNFKKLGRE